eukprot:EG_transcript_11159
MSDPVALPHPVAPPGAPAPAPLPRFVPVAPQPLTYSTPAPAAAAAGPREAPTLPLPRFVLPPRGPSLKGPLRSGSGVREGYHLAPIPPPDSPDPNAAPVVPLPAAECARLDAELTGRRCHEAEDPETQDRCRQLHTRCPQDQPDLALIQRPFPLYPPSCPPPAPGPGLRGAVCVPAYTPKFFQESWASGHLDSRWARTLTPPQQRQALQDLFAAWAGFVKERGLRYWLFGGGLIGWYFNKDMLPWDDDLDVHVLASDLLTHYQQYNTVTHKDRYYFEINPNSIHRATEGHNFIDARFIDKHTGRFIDVVALAYNPETRGLQCKHGEIFNPAHIFPIRRSTFMGSGAWVPRDVPQFLLRKYGPKVVLHQQPQHHPTSHCPPRGPCDVYHFDPSTSQWVDQRTLLQ